MPTLPELGWVDWTLLAVMTLSVIVGVLRGFVFELMSLAGWVVAWLAAPWAAVPLVQATGMPAMAAWLLGFIGVLVVWSLAARLIRLLIHATPLSIPDRLLGALFGALRGAVVLVVAATLLAFTPAAQSAPWRNSTGARWLDAAARFVVPLLPEPAARWLRGPAATS